MIVMDEKDFKTEIDEIAKKIDTIIQKVESADPTKKESQEKEE